MTRRSFALLLLLALGGCITAPYPNPRCIYPGDTLGALVKFDGSHHITECVWLLADHESCFEQRVQKTHLTCVVGDTNYTMTRRVRR